MSIESNASFVSKGVNNGFLLPFATSDQLEREVIDTQIGELQDVNTIGGDYDIGLSSKLKLNERASVILRLSDRWHLNTAFPNEAFQLGFMGNKAFAGDTASLGEAALYTLRFQEMGVGFQRHASPVLSYYGMVSLLKGEQMQELDLERGWLYTSEIGDTLVASGRGRFHQSDTGEFGLDAINGWGASVQLGVSVLLQGKESQWRLDAFVKDFGWINWNNSSFNYETDTVVRWIGVSIDNFETLGDSSLNGFDQDSLFEDFLGPLSRGNHLTFLPGWVQLQVTQEREKGWINGAGFVLRWSAGFLPYAWVQSGYQFNERFSAIGLIGYGGYGRGQLAIGANYSSNSVMARLQIQNLEAFAVPSKLGGAGVQCSIGYLF